MTAQDAPAVAELLRKSWQQTYEAMLGLEGVERASTARHGIERLAAEAADDNVMAFVAEDEAGALVGYAMARMDDNREVWLDRLHVAPGRFGTGLGADLMHVVLAAHAGLPSVSLEVIEGNDRAIGFYRKHGFDVVEHRDASHGIEGAPTLIMRKVLPRA